MRVLTFVGETSAGLASRCIESWTRNIPAHDLLLLDDGTLSAASVDTLRKLDSRVRIVSIEEASDVVASKLHWRKYDGLTKFARRSPLARKLIDIPLLGGDWINYVDSDVYFYRPVDVLWTQQVNHNGVWMMQDFQSAYALKRWQYLPALGPVVPRRANTGLISCTGAAYDPDYLDFAIRRFFDDGRLANWLAEQTLWAAMAFRRSLWFYDPKQFTFVNVLEESERPRMVALHWATPVRHLFDTVNTSLPRESTNNSQAELRLEAAKRLTATDVYGSLIRYSARHIAADVRHLCTDWRLPD